MPRFLHHPERPPIVEKKELSKELKEYPELNAKLTFSFPLNENRRKGLEMNYHKEELKEEKVVKLLESPDFIEKRVGVYLLKDVPCFSEKNYKKTLSILEEMGKDKDWVVQEAVAQALPQLGEKALPILKEMGKDENWVVREVAEIGIMKIKRGYKWFLATQKPLFATLFIPELARRVLKLQEISQELKKEFKDKFIGITIFGSTAKGYFKPESDLDWGMIAQTRECASKFIEMAKDLKLGSEHHADLNERYQIEKNEHLLFQGLFFGDNKKLLEIQRNFLRNIDEKKWDEIRKIIMKNEINLFSLFKTTERFSFKKDEIEKITNAILLLRVPPSHKEALEIVEKKAKQ